MINWGKEDPVVYRECFSRQHGNSNREKKNMIAYKKYCLPPQRHQREFKRCMHPRWVHTSTAQTGMERWQHPGCRSRQLRAESTSLDAPKVWQPRMLASQRKYTLRSQTHSQAKKLCIKGISEDKWICRLILTTNSQLLPESIHLITCCTLLYDIFLIILLDEILLE